VCQYNILVVRVCCVSVQYIGCKSVLCVSTIKEKNVIYMYIGPKPISICFIKINSLYKKYLCSSVNNVLLLLCFV
jgi:hypothetical protein